MKPEVMYATTTHSSIKIPTTKYSLSFENIF